jgi:hypothetical protein
VIRKAFLEEYTDDLSRHIITLRIMRMIDESPDLMTLKQECIQAIRQIDKSSSLYVFGLSNPNVKRRLDF